FPRRVSTPMRATLFTSELAYGTRAFARPHTNDSSSAKSQLAPQGPTNERQPRQDNGFKGCWHRGRRAIVRGDSHLGHLTSSISLGRKLLELSGMEIHEVAHVRRCFAGELAHGVCLAIVTPLPSQLGHGREMPDEVLRNPRPPKAFAPRREWDIAISDG